MMQADAVVQAPFNGQNLNRYSYVLNNPMSYTDPSGFVTSFAGLFFSGFRGVPGFFDLARHNQLIAEQAGEEPENDNDMAPMPQMPGISDAIFGANGMLIIGPMVLGQSATPELSNTELLTLILTGALDNATGDIDSLGGIEGLGSAAAEITGVGPGIEAINSLAEGDLTGVGIAAAGVVAGKAKIAGEVVERVAEEVPNRLARVVDARFGNSARLGGPGADDVFVTAADDIAGITNSADLARRLTLLDDAGNLRSGPFSVIEFDNSINGLASPVFRTNSGFLQGGLTKGGAREFVLPNGEVQDLTDVTRRIVE